MHRRLALAVGLVALLGAASAAAAPRVFVRGFRGPQAGDIKAGVAGAIRGAVEMVGSARAADAVVDGSVQKKGLNWVLSVTVRDSGGKALGGRSYPMPAPRVDRSTAEKLRRDIAGMAARAGKGGGAAAKAEPEPKAHKAKAPPKKVAKRDDDRPRRGKGKRSAADEADEEDRPRRGKGKRSAADEADEDSRPRKETAAQRRARERRERAERATEAKREKAEKARRAKEEKEAARRGTGKGQRRDDATVRGQVKQATDDEATDVVGPREKRADAKAARARQEKEERERKERMLAEANARLARAQAEARREREEERRRKEEEAAARRAEERRRKEEAAAARREEERRVRQEREDARRARVAADDERRAELRRAREAERRSREEEEDRLAAAKRRSRRDAEEDDDRRARRGRDEDDRDGRRLARRGDADDEADTARGRRRDDDDGAPRRSTARDDDGSSRRSARDAREEGSVRRSADRPAPPGRGPATIAAGVVLSTRHLEFSPKGQNLPIYDAPFFPAISVEGEIFPLALAGVRFGRDLGLFLRYDRVVGLTSQETDQDQTSPTFGQTFNFNNQSQRVEGGLVYRLHTGAAGLAPVIRPMLGVGYQTFSIGAKSTVPESAYTYVALGLGFYVPIGHPNFGAISTVRYHIIAGLGQVGGFGSAWTAWGVDLSVGLRLFIIRSVEVSAVYLYERVEMTYQGLGPLSSARGITPPSAGSDIYQGGRITLGYHF